jgi:cbb3-type cytochrome oxidase subunit 1
VLANVFGTMRGVWHKVAEDVNMKFLVTAAIFYLMACLQGPFQALMQVSAVVKFTHWVVGHAHMAPFAAFSFVCFVTIYYAVPRLTGRNIYSKALMNWHYYFSVIGFLMFAFTLWIAGVIQGFAWMEGTPFIETINTVRSLIVWRAVGGTMMIVGQFFFVFNLWRTVKAGTKFASDEESVVA